MDERRKIIVDFEWHKIPSPYPKQNMATTSEIIEFGAVMLDKNRREISSYKTYVKPQFIPFITRQIQKLTGITDEMLEDAPSFSEVLRDFVVWCESAEGKYEIYSWSNSDLDQIVGEIELKQINADESVDYMVSNWHDLQHEFDSELGFQRQLSLADAMYAAGIDAQGMWHDALDDARNTAALYLFLSDPVQQETTIKQIRSVLCHEEEDVPTLGDMVDLSQFACLLVV